MTQQKQNLEFQLYGPVVIVAGLSILAVIVLMVIMAGRVDAVAIAREQILVQGGVQERLAEVRRNAVAQAQATQTADHAFLVDADAAVISAAVRGRTDWASSWRPFADSFTPLLPQGRTAAVADVAAVKGQVYVLTAAPSATVAGASVLTARRLGAEFLGGLTDRFLIDGARLQAGAAPPPAGMAGAALQNLAGEPVAHVRWSPSTPGRQLYTTTILPIVLVVCCLAGIAFLTFGRGRQVAQGLVASEARAKHMALHDALTGLPNRVLFTDRLTHAIEQLRRPRAGEAVAVLCLDLDRFKEVNDTFGHQFGDELLREVARRLSETCRSSDTLARLGGDEFAIVQAAASAAGAAGLAARIIKELSAPIDLSVGQVFIGCSVGITVLENPDMDPADAMRQGDLALYRAKDTGRGQYCFFQPEMDAALRIRRAIEADLREALADEKLEMVYQAQVDSRGETVAVEALVRWTHPERGAIAPAFFVPIAEECGLIDQLGRFTLKTAFRDSRRWPGDVKVAVNISASQLRLRDFINTVTRLLEESGADARRFELEITEGVFLGDDPAVHETLRRLREMGFTLALDDFGTGYSSLSYLRRYPVDKIKIDRSFIASLGADREADAVVGAIVKLARALNLSVVAEGVETHDQHQRLAAAGCGDVQGFLFSRPMPAAEMDRAVGRKVGAA